MVSVDQMVDQLESQRKEYENSIKKQKVQIQELNKQLIHERTTLDKERQRLQKEKDLQRVHQIRLEKHKAEVAELRFQLKKRFGHSIATDLFREYMKNEALGDEISEKELQDAKNASNSSFSSAAPRKTIPNLMRQSSTGSNLGPGLCVCVCVCVRVAFMCICVCVCFVLFF